MEVKRALAILCCAAIMPAAALAAPAVTVNVPVDSVYYSYVEKLSGMGYISSMPNGAKPYSRMEMAKWVTEAQKKAAAKPMPAYLAGQFRALEQYLAPEIATLQGQPTRDTLKLRSVTAEAAYNHSDAKEYGYQSVAGSWQPFGTQHNGYRYGRDGNLIASAEISGNLGNDLAISLRPRFSYDKDNDGTVSLEEGYIKTRVGIWALEAGRQAMIWGQGASGNLLLGNNMKPLTTIQAHFLEPQKVGGFLRFLGEADFHAFYGRLDSDRSTDAASRGWKDYNDAGLLGLRLDITPTSYFTFGASRISMLGGKGNGLDSSDWGNWVTGTNADSHDKWDDIGGFDFRLRLPGVQWYGEFYGEDQAHGLPSDWAYRAGAYFPRLTKDGSWDLTVETAYTNDDWYRHGTFQDGWTYSGDIMGDAMGTNARKYYASVKHYLPHESYLGMYYMRTDMDRAVSSNPTVDEVALMGQRKLWKNIYLRGTLGIARVQNGDAIRHGTDHTAFATASVQWMY